MKLLLASVLACAFCAFGFAQQSPPPSDGVGLGQGHVATQSPETAQPPDYSPNQNATATDNTGRTNGDAGSPVFAGSSPQNAATRANSEGQAASTESTAATAARRRDYSRVNSDRNTKGGTNNSTSNSNNSKGDNQQSPDSQQK